MKNFDGRDFDNMCWFTKYVLPTLITVISGVLVYLIGELLNTIWLTPLQNYKKIKSNIAKNLMFYANVYSNVSDGKNESEEWKKLCFEASDNLRWLAAELNGFIQTLSWFKIGIPKRKNLKAAAESLIGLSNNMFGTDGFRQSTMNHDTAVKIQRSLKIYGYKK